MLHKFYLFRIQAFALSWICSTLTEFRNYAYRQSLLNLFAIRTNVRTQIRSARSSLEPKTRLTPCGSRHKHNKRVGDKHHQLFYGLRGARTLDQLIKSQLLYQLSYKPKFISDKLSLAKA